MINDTKKAVPVGRQKKAASYRSRIKALRRAQELEDKGVNLSKMSRHERRRSEKLLNLLAEQRELER